MANTGRRSGEWRRLCLGLVLGLLALTGRGLADTQTSQPVLDADAYALRVPKSVDDLRQLEQDIHRAYSRVAGATVAIRSGGAHGCGVIVNAEGYVLTAAHVAGRAGRVVDVLFPNGREVQGRSLGINHEVDAGMIRLLGPGPWPYAQTGSSESLVVGQWCLALGYPGGYDSEDVHPPILRVGRILQIGRRKTAILTDCTLIGGDSGGPLVSLDGHVIGVHSRIGADLTANLHVPIDEFRANWDRYVSGQTWGLSGYLGIGRAMGEINGRGAPIGRILPDSPASSAGLREGDRIIQIGDQLIDSFEGLRQLVRQYAPGDEIELRVARDDQTLPIRVRLGQSPQPPHSEEDAELLQSFLMRTGTRDMTVLQVGKNHQLIKSAAAKAVERAKLSVARVYADGRPVGLATVVSQHGYLVTKASELAGAQKIFCRFYGGRRIEAQQVSSSATVDLALLRVQASDLVPIEWSDVTAPAVGAWLATVSTGNAPLLIGNVSCAPRGVEREQGFLGVILESGQTNAVIVQRVLAGSAADRAGLRPGDQIVAVGNTAVASTDELISRVQSFWPGDSVDLNVVRGGVAMELAVRLGRQSDLEAVQSGFGDFLGSELSARRSGFPRVLQHDSVVLPELCGGPIVDLSGRCVGINIARADRVASYALPAQDVRRWAEQVILAAHSSPSVLTTSRPVAETSQP